MNHLRSAFDFCQFQVYFGGGSVCNVSTDSLDGWFHGVGAHKLWKPASHQTGVTVGGEVKKMPCSFHPLTPSALAGALRHGKGERLCNFSQRELTQNHLSALQSEANLHDAQAYTH